MSTVITSDKHYKAIAEKTRAILGTTTEYKPSEIPQAILDCQSKLDKYNSISCGVSYTDESTYMIGDKLVDGMFAYSNITTFTIPEHITEVPDYTFAGSDISNITLHDNVTSIGKGCFEDCTNLKDIVFPSGLTQIGKNAFYYTKLSGRVILPDSMIYIGSNAFLDTDITVLDIPRNVLLDNGLFSYFDLVDYCDKLVALIIRNDSNMYVNKYTTNYFFNGTAIKNGTGYIYVPSALLDSYKTADGWSTLANQFRPLEEYTVDGTTTGAFDYSKI